MKYALALFCSFFFFAADRSEARTIESFRDSDALTGLAQFLYDVSEDMPYSSRLSDKKLYLKDFSKCTDVTSDYALSMVESAVKNVLRYYSDEDVPFEQAMIDLEDYLNNQTLKKCLFEKKKHDSLIKSAYFVDQSDKIHLRLDIVHLSEE